MTPTAFAHRLTEALKARGWSQTEFVRRVSRFRKVSDSAVSLWMSGQRLPSIQYALPIADALAVTVEWLLGRNRTDGKATYDSPEVRETEAVDVMVRVLDGLRDLVEKTDDETDVNDLVQRAAAMRARRKKPDSV